MSPKVVLNPHSSPPFKWSIHVFFFLKPDSYPYFVQRKQTAIAEIKRSKSSWLSITFFFFSDVCLMFKVFHDLIPYPFKSLFSALEIRRLKPRWVAALKKTCSANLPFPLKQSENGTRCPLTSDSARPYHFQKLEIMA